MSHPNFHPYGLPTYSRTKRSRSPFLAWLTVLLSLNPALAEPPANPAESGTGQVLFKTERGYTRALHLDSSLNIEINGLIARVEFTQSFSNPDPLWREGVYVFPLPEKAAVNYMEVRAGESTIVATIRERREARRVYNAAKAAGQTAALTEQERPNLFTQSVANIGPNETVTITLRYIQRVDFHDGDFSLRFPMTLTPRYNPGIQLIDNREETYSTAQNGSGWGVATHLVPDATRITPP
ncbi:MAG: VIT domain-containing protein, partial [Pseudomonadota bacterium]